MTTRAGYLKNRTNTLASFAYGTEPISETASQMDNHGADSNCLDIQEEYMDEETEGLNEKGKNDLLDLCKNNQEFRDETINFVGDKAELSNEKILDKRYKYKNLKKLGM